MNIVNLATLGVRLIGVAVVAIALIVGGSAAVFEISQGTERRTETKSDRQQTTTTTTIVQRSFDPLLLVPSAAGLALGLLLIFTSGPVARLLILRMDE
jgi:hypothetical protein